MDKNIIIIGSSGYIGNYLTTFLISEGFRNVKGFTSAEINFLDFYQVQKMFSLFAKRKYVIIFLASINRSTDNSYSAFKKNIEIVQNFIENIDLIEVEQLIYASTVDVYGSTIELPISEDTKLMPNTWYGHSKCVCEWLITNSRKVTFPVTIIRLPGIFGSAKNDRSVIGSLIRAISSKSELYLTSAGLEKRDYVNIADLCNLIVQLIDVRSNGILNIATGVSNSIIEIINEIKCALGRDCELKISESVGDRSFDLVFDNTKIKQLLPLFNFSTLRDGIMSYKE